MLEILPDWVNKFEEDIDKLINSLCLEESIDFESVSDSMAISHAKSKIVRRLVNIQRNVNNPFSPTKPDFETLVKKTKMKLSVKKGRLDGRRRPLTEEHIRKIKRGIKKRHREGAYKKNATKIVLRGRGNASIIRRRKRKQNKYPKEMEDFVRYNLNKATNKQLIELIQDKFRIKTTIPRLANYMFMRRIKRK